MCPKILHPLKNKMENCGPHLFVLTFEAKIMGVCMKLRAKHLFGFFGTKDPLRLWKILGDVNFLLKLFY